MVEEEVMMERQSLQTEEARRREGTGRRERMRSMRSVERELMVVSDGRQSDIAGG